MKSTWVRWLAVVVLMGFPALDGFAWTIKISFDHGPVGAYANQEHGYNGFHGAGAATVFTNEMAVDGKQSCKMSWKKGHNGWALDHGRVTFTDAPGAQSLKDGDELWVRGYFYFKSPWDWYVPGGPFNKILRVHTKHADGSHAGYISFFSDSRGQIISDSEISPRLVNRPTGYYFEADRWQCLEMYIRFSVQNPVLRMWLDGELIFEDTSKNTLDDPTTVADMSYIGTAWAGGAPQDQVEYIDALVYTSDRPLNQDADGNPMVGPIGWKNK